MDQQIKRIITPEQIQSDQRRMTLIQGKLKYSFWKTKQDGTPTKAFQQFQALNVQEGKSYEAEVAESEESFVNQQGKTINFVRRNILFFYTGETQDTSMYTQPDKTSQNAILELTERLDKAAQAFKTMEGKINELEMRLSVLEMEQEKK